MMICLIFRILIVNIVVLFCSYLFWFDKGNGGDIGRKLARANMDGSDAKILATLNLSMLTHLTLDLQQQLIYFTLPEKGTVLEFF